MVVGHCVSRSQEKGLNEFQKGKKGDTVTVYLGAGDTVS